MHNNDLEQSRSFRPMLAALAGAGASAGLVARGGACSSNQRMLCGHGANCVKVLNQGCIRSDTQTAWGE